MANHFVFSSPFGVVNWVVLALIIVTSLLIYYLRHTTLLLKNLNEKMENLYASTNPSIDEAFDIEKAEKWFEKGDISALKKYCNQFIKDNPNSVQANWFYALGQYNQGDYLSAKEYFERVINLNPLWREGATVYLQEIANKSRENEQQTFH